MLRQKNAIICTRVILLFMILVNLSVFRGVYNFLFLIVKNNLIATLRVVSKNCNNLDI